MKDSGAWALATIAMCGSVASAQIAPGIVPPKDARTAAIMSQMVGCTFAVLGRPSPVSTRAGYPEGGLVFQEAVPEEISSATGLGREEVLAFTLASPEGPVWILNQIGVGKCAVATTSGNLPATTDLFRADYAKGIAGYRKVKSDRAGLERYRSKATGLTVYLKPSTGSGDPFAVITEKSR